MVTVPSFRPNVNFPQLCDKVVVGWDEKRGRFIKATDNIPMGTVVCVEQGVTVNVDPNYCYRCLGLINESDFAYCTDCEDFYEPDEIAQGHFDPLGIFKLASHLVFTYPFVDLLDLLQSDDPQPSRSAPESLSTTEIESVYQLTMDPEIGDKFKEPKIQEAIKKIVVALETDENWGQLDYNARRMTFTKGLRIMAERCVKNAHMIRSIPQKERNDPEEVPVGTGLFPIASIFNHSCTPNIHAFYVKNTIIYVSRGVQAGQELVDSYGVTYRQHTLEERTHHLPFQCHCESCVEKKSLDVQLEKNFNDADRIAQEAKCFLEIEEAIEYIEPGRKEIETAIIAFSKRKDSEQYKEKMFEMWKKFMKTAKNRGIYFDPYLIRPYIELTVLAWSEDVECSEAEKADHLMVAHRHLVNFYGGLHPLGGIIKKLVDESVKEDSNSIRSTVQKLNEEARSIWKYEF